MGGNVKIMLALAVVCGGGAIWAGESWLDNETTTRMRQIEAARPEITFGTIVVAAHPLRYGETAGARDVKEIPWPGNDLPAGAFATIADFTGDGPRTVLFPIEASEPMLASKTTGPGERAALSRLIAAGNRAVTIRVNEVAGVAGFVLPGDHVDVVLTTDEKAEVIIQDLRILSIDQSADERADAPKVAQTVTVEATPENAQRLVLAQNVGNLSLVLRKAGESALAAFRPLSTADLNSSRPATVAAALSPATPRPAPEVTVWVRRATTLTQYSVPTGAGGPMQPVGPIAVAAAPTPVTPVQVVEQK
jgi:pilus assembly protein CpaB